MHALIAFAIGPIGRYVVLGALLLALIGGVYLKVRSDGAEAERVRIERANAKARDAADSAMRGPLECLGTWDRSTGTCER
jgi:hypothetical protein